jgi:DNA-binding MarR family transcriptional regulator
MPAAHTPPAKTLAAAHSPVCEAWSLIYELVLAEKPRLNAIAGEFEIKPQQAYALRLLEEPRTMSELADILACDNSNVTGLVDRLEQRGLVERRAGERDRRVKLLVLTDEGERVRAAMDERMRQAPEALTALPAADQRALRDLLRKSLG